MEEKLIQVPIPVFCGPIIRREVLRPCSVYFDLTILPDNDSESSILLDSVTFDNYFTYSLTIMQPINGTDDYCTILEGRKLMFDPSAEVDAQLSNTIHISEFNHDYIPGRALRFMLHQPCSDWKHYELRNVKAFAKPVVANARKGEGSGKGGGNNSLVDAVTDRLTQAVDDIEKIIVADFRAMLARCNKVNHNKLALGSQLEVEIATKKSRKSKKSSKSS